ncbi:hypothetical protein UPYG_G00243690 [Umbra pygmaea]|uniref:Ig-like domain-containing protein n=1 Tax=Umbra pygmaea TaxID=75934 RepID=A0ABD0WFU8_UMBPY
METSSLLELQRHRQRVAHCERGEVTAQKTKHNTLTCRVNQQQINLMMETHYHVPAKVVCQSEPVVSVAGEDVILPCTLRNPVSTVNAVDEVVEWQKHDLSKVVHFYRYRGDYTDDQNPSYRGRTSLFKEEMKNGNISLKLTNVKLTDAGNYTCFVPSLNSPHQKDSVQLIVGAVSRPDVSVVGMDPMVLQCEVKGLIYKPEVTWLDSDGNILPAGTTETQTEGRYTVRGEVTVQKTKHNTFTCRVNQQQINLMMETHYHVPAKVVCQSEPVVSVAGEDVILPCTLRNPVSTVNAVDEVVEWQKHDLSKVVHFYRYRGDYTDDQNPSYRGRTSLFKEEMKNGNISLKLTNVKLTDAGNYTCFVPSLNSPHQKDSVHLIVGAVSRPDVSVVGMDPMVLQCEVKGLIYKPEVTWLDSDGNILPAGTTETQTEGRYTVRGEVTVQKTKHNTFTCRVNQQQINLMMETHYHVPESWWSSWWAGLICFFTLLILVAGVFTLKVLLPWIKGWITRPSEQKREHQMNRTSRVPLTVIEVDTSV